MSHFCLQTGPKGFLLDAPLPGLPTLQIPHLYNLITPHTCVQLQALYLGDPGPQGPVLAC